ncbi:MAG: aldo/keto reductase [Gemmatimonadales bacterium]|jgi:aryl-alcohol dehydrogenase-like predicted oxidoreductase|nr:MAG: aldo/keto reductase [Gemmatimonadales bacterium]
MLQLPRRRMGSTDLEITNLGLGTWAIGGPWAFGWGPQDDAESVAAIHRAAELGINWIDTAAVYGLGHSEQIVGQALASLPAADRPLVFTKCGLIWDENDRMAEPRRVLEPSSIRRECEASLRRLGMERIDLYQFHWPDETGTAVEDSWDVMLRLVEEGKVRWGGVCNFDTSLLGRCAARGTVASLQPPFSLIRRRVAASEIPWCETHGVGVIAYSPMQSGLLTDRFSAPRLAALPVGDYRHRGSEFTAPRFAANLALRDGLRPIAERHRATVGEIAIAWVLAWPGVTGAIVGARSAAQVDGWIGAGSLRLSEPDLVEIAEAIRRSGAGEGPARP